MAGNKLLKLFITISFLLAASFHIQPSCAMEGEKENADIIDHLHGIDLYIPAPVVYFFQDLPDEIAMKVFVHLYRDKKDINNLIAIALTCMDGHRLMQNSNFWDELKKVYFDDLPQEYIAVLQQDRNDGGLKLCSTVFEQLLRNQADEIKRLSHLLSRHSDLTSPESSSILIKKISKNAKQRWLKKLEALKKFEEGLNPLEAKENLVITKNPALKRFSIQEVDLDFINCEIIRQSLPFMRIQTSKTNHTTAHLNLRCSLTRVPREAVRLFRGWMTSNTIDDVVLDLSYNGLRWIPDELFSIKKIMILALMNNHLCSLPKTIECIQDHLISLNLGNFEAFHPLLTNHHGRRTSGNVFRKVPPIILKLSKLEGLDMSSVQLEECSEDIIYEALPQLSDFNVTHNNLLVIPKSRFQDREIFVWGYGNPGSPSVPILYQIVDACYNMGTQLWSLCNENTLRIAASSIP